MADKVTRTGKGTKLYITTLEPAQQMDVQGDGGISWGDSPHPVADATRLDDAQRRFEAAGVPDTPTVEVMVFDTGIEILRPGARHRFRLVYPPARGETSGPQREFDAVVINDSGPRFSTDANPLVRTLTLKVSGDVAYTAGSTEIVQS